MIDRSNLQDVLPQSPVQEGLLFHTLLDDHGPDVYTNQIILDVDGDLDAAALHTAGKALLDHYLNLRAAFRRTTKGRFVSLIGRQVRLPCQAVDLSSTVLRRLIDECPMIADFLSTARRVTAKHSKARERRRPNLPRPRGRLTQQPTRLPKSSRNLRRPPRQLGCFHRLTPPPAYVLDC